MDDYFKTTLENIKYALVKILNALKVNNLDIVDWITRQEIKAINHDLSILEGGAK